ncbi:hypothetical protein IFM5058_09849 [Aspergillus udagawae]|nr:hypothetical protein IFM5058_09849 [Aspergillus udagawae]
MRLFQQWQRDKCQIFMIGPDTSQLRERILNLEAYYKRYQGQELPQLEVRVVGLPPMTNNQKGAKRLARLKNIYQNRRNDKNVRGLTPNTMVGDSILVKLFDLFPSGGDLDSVIVDGMPYIDAAAPFCLQEELVSRRDVKGIDVLVLSLSTAGMEFKFNGFYLDGCVSYLTLQDS